MTTERLYAVVDAAADDTLYGLVQACVEKQCLFAGEIHETLARASPWLVTVGPQDQLYAQWRDAGRGQAWGLFLQSPRTFPEVRRHLRHFLQAMLPDGDVVLFRFYDPRIFRTYLPTCTPEELGHWFKGISNFIVEDAAGQRFHSFSLSDGQLTDHGAPV